MENVSITFTPKEISEYSNEEISHMLKAFTKVTASNVNKYRGDNPQAQFDDVHGYSLIEALDKYNHDTRTGSRDLASYLWVISMRNASDYLTREKTHGFIKWDMTRIPETLHIISLDETEQGNDAKTEYEIWEDCIDDCIDEPNSEIEITKTLTGEAPVIDDMDKRLDELHRHMKRLKAEFPDLYEAITSRELGAKPKGVDKDERARLGKLRDNARNQLRRYFGIRTTKQKYKDKIKAEKAAKEEA